jgi:hypothetical protein
LKLQRIWPPITIGAAQKRPFGAVHYRAFIHIIHIPSPWANRGIGKTISATLGADNNMICLCHCVINFIIKLFLSEKIDQSLWLPRSDDGRRI